MTPGQVLMLYGVCMVFIGPWISKTMDTAGKIIIGLFVGSIVLGIAAAIASVDDDAGESNAASAFSARPTASSTRATRATVSASA